MNSEISQYLKYTNVQDDVSGIKRLSFILNFLSSNYKKAKVLDIGCGTGSITIPLGLNETYEITGVDIDKKSIEIAKRRNTFKNVNFLSKDTKEFNDKFNETFDIVLCIQVLEHLKNPEDIITELFRLTNKYAIITIPNGFGPSEIVGRLISRLRKSTGLTKKLKAKTKTNEGLFTANTDNPHIQKFTIKKMRVLAEKTGFNIKIIKNHNFLLGTFPFNQLFFHTPFKRVFETIDEKIADVLPHFMASGWYFVMEKHKEENNKELSSE